MNIVFSACLAPIIDITGPLYHLIRSDIKPNSSHYKSGISPQQVQLCCLFRALFRTATVAALFWIFGGKGMIINRFSFAAQWLIHPYAAALSNACIRLYPLTMKIIALLSKGQFFNSKDYIGDFFAMIAFCILAIPLKNYTNALDRQYFVWSCRLAMRLGKKQEPLAASNPPTGFYGPPPN